MISAMQRVARALFERSAYVAGGAVNPYSGIGTANDKTATTQYVYQSLTQYALEILYKQSWAAAKMIDIPVDDAFHLPRTAPEGQEYLDAARREFGLDAKLRRALKTARLHGGAAIVLFTEENDLAMPLDAERIRPGDVSNLLVLSRWNCHPIGRIENPWNPEYGYSDRYSVRTYGGGAYEVHVSRMVRLEGQRSLSEQGPDMQGWGTSILNPVLASLKAEDATALAAAQLAQEKSILVVQSKTWKMATDGAPTRGGANMGAVEQMAQTQSRMMGVWNKIFTSVDEDVKRIDANLSGLAQVMEAQSVRVAAAAGIPYTRFMSQSPAGMNATGDSDARNYALLVRSLQREWMEPAYAALDPVLARALGMQPPETFDFPSLAEPTDFERTQELQAMAQYVKTLVDGGIMSRDAAQAYVQGADAAWQDIDVTAPVEAQEQEQEPNDGRSQFS